MTAVIVKTAIRQRVRLLMRVTYPSSLSITLNRSPALTAIGAAEAVADGRSMPYCLVLLRRPGAGPCTAMRTTSMRLWRAPATPTPRRRHPLWAPRRSALGGYHCCGPEHAILLLGNIPLEST